MKPFIKAYLKCYGLLMLAFFFNFVYVWYINHYWNGGNGEPVNYERSVVILSLLAFLLALGDTSS